MGQCHPLAESGKSRAVRLSSASPSSATRRGRSCIFNELARLPLESGSDRPTGSVRRGVNRAVSEGTLSTGGRTVSRATRLASCRQDPRHQQPRRHVASHRSPPEGHVLNVRPHLERRRQGRRPNGRKVAIPMTRLHGAPRARIVETPDDHSRVEAGTRLATGQTRGPARTRRDALRGRATCLTPRSATSC